MPEEKVSGQPADGGSQSSDAALLGFSPRSSTEGQGTGDGQATEGGDGVAEKGTPEGAAAGGGEGKQGAPEAPSKAGPSRDASGRFAAKASTGEGTVATDSPKFSFLGEEYDDQAGAEQKWRSYFGRVKAWQEKYESLQAQYNAINERLNRSAGEPAQPITGASDAAKDAAKQVSDQLPAELAEVVDYDLFGEVWDDPSLGPKQAMRYVMQKVGEFVGGLKKELAEPRTDPRVEAMFGSHQEAQLFNSTVATMQSLSERHDGKGNYLYPELQEDQDFVARVTRRWLSDESLRGRGEYGAHLAYLDEKAWDAYMVKDISRETPAPRNGSPSKPSTAPVDRVVTDVSAPSPHGPMRARGRVDSIIEEMEAMAMKKKDNELLGF